jgi:transcription elongation factor Elf1
MCACKGKIGQDKKFFTCPRCQKGFHYECLLLESEIGILHKRTDVICPPCAVKNPNTNIYYNILG